MFKHSWVLGALALLVALQFVSITPRAYAGVSRDVKFAAGSSGTVIDGNVLRGERDTYRLGARRGQRMTCKVKSPENNVVFDVVSPSRGVLATEQTSWNGSLPATETYKIVVGTTRGNGSYSLTVSIR